MQLNELKPGLLVMEKTAAGQDLYKVSNVDVDDDHVTLQWVYTHVAGEEDDFFPNRTTVYHLHSAQVEKRITPASDQLVNKYNDALDEKQRKAGLDK